MIKAACTILIFYSIGSLLAYMSYNFNDEYIEKELDVYNRTGRKW